MGERESKRLYRKLRISGGGGDRHHDMTIAPDTTVVRVEVTRVSGDPPFFHGLVSIGGDTREATFSENTITFSDTALADLGENIIIYGEATLTTSNSDTTMVNFIGEVRVDSAEVSGDPVIFHGLVNIGGDTTGITFSGDTVIVPDTVEFIEPFSDSLIITISGNTARITFPDTVIIAVDSTKPPSNPASTAVFGGARLTMRNYKSSSASRHEWTYYLLGGTKEQLSVWQGTQTSEVGFCGSTRGSQIYFYPTEYLTYAIEYPGIREDIPRLRLQPDGGIEYRITDHLGSNRVTLDGSGVVTNRYDYKPFGGILSSGGEARQGFNSREKDQESDLFNNGVRKLDDNIGRFTSIDPLWESFPSWSPYQYGYNNPLRVTDPGGMQGRTPITPQVEMGPDGLPSLYGGLHYPSNAIGKAVAGDQPMRTSERGREFIKSYEGLRLNVYNDQAGYATIGYGRLLRKKPYTETDIQTITEAEADAFFDEDVKEKAEDHVNSAVSVSLTQNQFDALISLTFNIGGDAFRNSSVARLLNERKYEAAAEAFKQWRKVTIDGKKVDSEGLIRRRSAEVDIFLYGEYEYNY